MFRILYPQLIICNINGRIVITTHKIASRFLEEKSGTCENFEEYPKHFMYNSLVLNIGNVQPSLNTVLNYELSNMEDCEGKIESFLKPLDVEKIEDIFTNFPITFITRGPWDRFWSGLWERIDPFIQARDMIKNKQSAFNKKVVEIDKNILCDTHCSLWNTFLIEFILHYQIKDHEVIDLYGPIFKERFGEPKRTSSLESNKIHYQPWLENESNKPIIEELRNKINPYMGLEVESYKKLLNYE